MSDALDAHQYNLYAAKPIPSLEDIILHNPFNFDLELDKEPFDV